MLDKMGTLRRSHYCGQLRNHHVGSKVVICGFVQRRRDLGNLIFLDVRDRTGIVQLAFGDSVAQAIKEKASSVRSEFVVMASGVVRLRESVNKDIPTGDIEIIPEEFLVLSQSQVTPFEIADEVKAKEELRLRYRYLDLRRAPMQQAIMMRHKIVKEARNYFDDNGFLEIETPVLIGSTPEGARDYLVPSRVQKGKFYALPQSPQLYKQLLMLSGFDRYMQVARCFRDEDLRADRQPEFTQIDLEMSFADVDDVISVNEGFMVSVFQKVLGVEVKAPFPRISYREAMERYGSDKPDTRFGLTLVDFSDIVGSSAFSVFSSAVGSGGSVRGINVKGGAACLSRKEIDKLTEFVKTYKAKGLAFVRLTPDGETSSYEKFLTEDERAAIRKRAGAEQGDVLLLVADADNAVVFDSLGQLRNELAKKLELLKPGTFDLLWVVDFPQFEYDEEEGRYVSKHHPFTSPKDEHIEKLLKNPDQVLAKAYDLVLNGTEVGGGSVRINDPVLQAEMFKALGFTPEKAQEQFGFLMEAFSYGAPPHAGMAYGLDRLVMLLLGKSSIRDVIAFPKVQNAGELMTSTPSVVEQKQLDELGIQIALKKQDIE